MIVTCLKCKKDSNFLECSPVWDYNDVKSPTYMCNDCKPVKNMKVKFSNKAIIMYPNRNEVYEKA